MTHIPCNMSMHYTNMVNFCFTTQFSGAASDYAESTNVTFWEMMEKKYCTGEMPFVLPC